MKVKNFLLFAALLPSVLLAQELDRYNALSYSTSPLRPVMGILDLNVVIPTKPTQALITGIHHYSYLYDYTRPDEAAELNFLQSHTENEYTEWIMSNVIALDYRFYWMKTKRNGRKVARYFTVLNRLPVIKWNYSTDIQLNPEYTNWYDQNYDPNDSAVWNSGNAMVQLFRVKAANTKRSKRAGPISLQRLQPLTQHPRPEVSIVYRGFRYVRISTVLVYAVHDVILFIVSGEEGLRRPAYNAF